MWISARDPERVAKSIGAHLERIADQQFFNQILEAIDEGKPTPYLTLSLFHALTNPVIYIQTCKPKKLLGILTKTEPYTVGQETPYNKALLEDHDTRPRSLPADFTSLEPQQVMLATRKLLTSLMEVLHESIHLEPELRSARVTVALDHPDPKWTAMATFSLKDPDMMKKFALMLDKTQWAKTVLEAPPEANVETELPAVKTETTKRKKAKPAKTEPKPIVAEAEPKKPARKKPPSKPNGNGSD